MHIVPSLIVAIFIGIIATVIFALFSSFNREASRRSSVNPPPRSVSSDTDPDDDVQEIILPKYNNIYTKVCALIVAGLLVLGLSMIVLGSAWGIVFMFFGGLVWKAGEIDHTVKPLKAGMITFRSKPVTRSGTEDLIVIGGRVILAPYWPFYLSTAQVDLTTKNKDFKFNIVSADDVPMTVVLSVNISPDRNDLGDFIKATGSEGVEAIFPLIDDIAKTETQSVITKGPVGVGPLEAMKLVQQPRIVSDALKDILEDHFEKRHFGVKIRKTRFNPELPENLKKIMARGIEEDFERKAEVKNAETYRNLAKERQKAYEADIHKKDVPSLKDVLAEMREERLIDDGKMYKIDSGGTGSVSIANLNLSGDDKKKKKE